MTGTAYGMVTAVVAVYLNKVRDIDTATIGVLAIFFAAGIVLFSVPMGKAIQRFAPRHIPVARAARILPQPRRSSRF